MLKPHYKIVLISSGQPSVNPRLVKEADALTFAGYQVTVIYQYWNSWATQLDKQLLTDKKWKMVFVGGNPNDNKIPYWISRIIYKLGNIAFKRIGFKLGIAEISIGRCTYLLKKKAKQIPADLYIAHNLAALPAAVFAAEKNKGKCAFDAEDFHRNEVSDDPENFDVKLKTYIEDKYFPSLDYLTTSSPLISEAYEKLYPKLKPIYILNVFSRNFIIERVGSTSSTLKLFWFSQTIGKNRGLEQIIKAIGITKSGLIELHLLGNHDEVIKNDIYNIVKSNGVDIKNIHFYKPIPADEIFSFAEKFDIGLATEIDLPKNRDICLTNKIFTYIQSGLAIIASDTAAQKALLSQFKAMGEIYSKYNTKDLATILERYLFDRKLLLKHQQQGKKYAINTLNWDFEKQKFLTLINETLDN